MYVVFYLCARLGYCPHSCVPVSTSMKTLVEPWLAALACLMWGAACTAMPFSAQVVQRVVNHQTGSFGTRKWSRITRTRCVEWCVNVSILHRAVAAHLQCSIHRTWCQRRGRCLICLPRHAPKQMHEGSQSLKLWPTFTRYGGLHGPIGF